jgi:hypothetical protein
MKSILMVLIFLSNTAFAGYNCFGPKKTSVENFVINELSTTTIDTSFDGGFDSVEEDKDELLTYTYNNGCDNELYFKISKYVSKYNPQVFSMKMDYLTQEEFLKDVQVVCYKIEE